MVQTVATGLGRADPGSGAGPTGVVGGAVQVIGLTKAYDDAQAVRGIDLDIASGEFFSLLGPSGCGKTTTLRMIAGFERPTAGRILLDGRDVSSVPPHKRPINTVFQNYALFPFMSVRDNVAFGLRYCDLSKGEARRRCDEALAMVQLTQFARRRPHQLSGGQQQRVALARSLVLNPRVLLLDEPLGALDAKLRKALQVELKALQERVGVTFVYVTHDQDEALTMSDRLAVMAAGRVEQVGTPEQVYESPATAYVADFLGTANLVPVEVLGPDGEGLTAYRLDGRTLHAAASAHPPGPATLVVRPERVVLHAVPDAGAGLGAEVPQPSLPGRVERVVYRGAVVDVAVRTDAGTPFTATIPADGASQWTVGGPLRVGLRPAVVRLLPAHAQPDDAGGDGDAGDA